MRGNFAIFMALTISGVLNFTAIALYSRLLSPAEYGAYSVILAGVSLVLGFAFSWLELSFLRFVAGSEREGIKHIFSNFAALYAVLLLMVSGFLLIVFLANVFTAVPVFVWPIIVVVIASEVIFIAVNNHARLVNGALILYSVSVISRSILAISLGWYFVTLGYSYAGIIAGSACSFLIPAVVVAFKGRIWRDCSLASFDYHLVREICHFGMPLVLVMVVQSAISATDRFLLVGMLGAEITGQYSASQDLVVKLFIFLLAIVHKVTYPLAVKKFENDGVEGARGQLKQNIILLLAISVPAVFAMSIYAANIVDVILGEEFRDVAADLMPYQVFIAFINCITMFYIVMPFHLMKKTQILVIPGLVALLGNLVVGYFAIGVWGFYGAVLGSFVAYSLYFFLSLALGRKFLKLPTPGFDAAKIIFASALMALILLPFKEVVGLWPLIGLVVTGSISYGLICLGLNTGGLRDLGSGKLRRMKSVKS